MTEFNYHQEDYIAVFKYGDYDKYDRSIEIANFVVDLDEEGDFLGLEVINASERLPLSKEELSSVRQVKTTVFDDEDDRMVSILVYYDDDKTSLNVPFSNSSTGQSA